MLEVQEKKRIKKAGPLKLVRLDERKNTANLYKIALLISQELATLFLLI